MEYRDHLLEGVFEAHLGLIQGIPLPQLHTSFYQYAPQLISVIVGVDASHPDAYIKAAAVLGELAEKAPPLKSLYMNPKIDNFLNLPFETSNEVMESVLLWAKEMVSRIRNRT